MRSLLPLRRRDVLLLVPLLLMLLRLEMLLLLLKHHLMLRVLLSLRGLLMLPHVRGRHVLRCRILLEHLVMPSSALERLGGRVEALVRGHVSILRHLRLLLRLHLL